MGLPYFVVCVPGMDCGLALRMLRMYSRRRVGFYSLRWMLKGRRRWSSRYTSWGRSDVRDFAEILVDVVEAPLGYARVAAAARSVAKRAPRRVVVVTVKLPEQMIELLDRISKREGVSRSEVIRRILLWYVHSWRPHRIR